jgi:hypothetical protein
VLEAKSVSMMPTVLPWAITHLRVLRIWSLEDVSQQCSRRLSHDRSSECIALIRPQIMALSPATTHQLLEVRARIKLFVLWREVVEEFGRSMDACWGEADVGFLVRGFRDSLSHWKRLEHCFLRIAVSVERGGNAPFGK